LFASTIYAKNNLQNQEIFVNIIFDNFIANIQVIDYIEYGKLIYFF